MQKVKQYALYSAALFALLFVFRLGYDYLYPRGNSVRNIPVQTNESEFSSTSRKMNIASAKVKYQSDTGSVKTFDQKYEKIADITARTGDLESDEKAARDLVKRTDSVIQFENTSGLKARHNRVIRLTIGVPPDAFDETVGTLKTIGTLQSLSIDKRDKTNEYKDLQSKKISLTKIRSSLIQLKSKGGKIDEYINLENRILEIEEQIQKLGVSLGEFDAENEFCTVNFTLKESGITSAIPFLHRVKVALEWAFKYYFLFALGFFLFLGSILIGLNLLEKILRHLKPRT